MENLMNNLDIETQLRHTKQAVKELQEENKELTKEANTFIIDIAKLLDIDSDGVGFDGLTLSIDDFKEAINKLKQ